MGYNDQSSLPGWVLEVPGELGGLLLLLPSRASCSKKSDQSSANDSFRLPLSGKKSLESEGVLGVRCHGETGTLRDGLDAPGLARPACSRCSTADQYGGGLGAGFQPHTISPPKESGNDLQHLEFLGIRSLESKKMHEMIGDELPIDGQHALRSLPERETA